MTASPAPVELARAAAAAARQTPGVLDLDAGALGEFATYGGGTRIPGVRVAPHLDPSVRLRLVTGADQPLPELAADVRARVIASLADAGFPARRVDIHIAGVRQAEEEAEEEEP